MKKPNIQRYVLLSVSLIAGLFWVSAYQACTPASPKFEGIIASNSASTGRGDSYDGKPQDGHYYRVVPDNRCGTELALYGEIEVKAGTAKARTLDQETCEKKETSLDLVRLEYNAYAKEMLGYQDGAFRKQAVPPDLTQRTELMLEAWCRALDSSQSSGLDVIVLSNPSTAQLDWVVVEGKLDASNQLVATQTKPAAPTRRVANGRVSYSASELEVAIDPRPLSGVKSQGRIKGSLNGRAIDASISCRMAGALDIQAPTPALTCPAGYVPVQQLLGYTSSDFCVAKYESKQEGPRAVSAALGMPWVQVDRATALDACRANGVQYDLISNSEWQTIARGVEVVASNWSGQTIGSVGGLNRGHSDNIPAIPLEASNDDDQSCVNTGEACNLSTWNAQRRTFALANGSIIWDLAGNVIEWIRDDVSNLFGPRNPISLVMNTAPYSNSAKDLFGPAGDYSTLTTDPYGGLGLFEPGTSGALVRGGTFFWGTDSGVFQTTLTVAADSTQTQLGFRCTYHP